MALAGERDQEFELVDRELPCTIRPNHTARSSQMRDADVEQKLRRAGVPDAVISHAIKHAGRWYLGGLAFAAVWVPVVIGGYWAGSKLWSWLEGITENNAVLHAESADALMYHFNFGVSLLIGLFAWLAISAALVGSLGFLSNRSLSAGFVSTIWNDDGTSSVDWVNRRLIDRLRNETNPERYIIKMNLGWLLIVTIFGVSLAIISAVAVFRDIQSYSILTPQSYIDSPFLPGPSRARDWSAATSVVTGCSHSDRDNIDTIRYKVTFADGASVDVGRATAMTGDWLSAVEAIDREVRKSGAAFSPWNWLWYEPFDPLCIKSLQARFPGQEFDRVKRVLRLPG